MLKRRTRLLALLHLALDLATTALALLLAYSIRFRSGLFSVPDVHPMERYLDLLPFIFVIWPAVFFFQGLYRIKRGDSRIDELFQIVSSTALALLVLFGSVLYYRQYVLHGVADEFQYSQKALILFGILDMAGIFLARMACRGFLEHRRRQGKNLRNVLIAGAGTLGKKVADRILAHDALGFHVVGFLDDDVAKQGTSYRGVEVIGSLDDAARFCAEGRIDHVYVALPLASHRAIEKLLSNLAKEIVDVKIVPDFLEYVFIRAGIEDLDDLPIISLSQLPLQGWNGVLKRSIDLLLSAFLLVLLSPLFALIALCIKLSSKGPVFYRQERMGLDGKSFMMYKFRSMKVDAEKETGPVFAAKEDDRRTRIGTFLRKFSLDELPQLFDVMLGRMSLVGPRPERPKFVKEFKERIPQYMLRHKVKSGITGWAQVNGWRGNTSIGKRIECDIYYIEHWSVALDLKILWMTAFRGFRHRNAY